MCIRDRGCRLLATRDGDAASRAEEAARAVEEARARGFARDCGDNPSYCMYERAGRLAGLSGADNPLFASVDSWSFSVPLERARAYYRERLLSERPAFDSAEEQARSALRKRFYAYAISELREAFVHETADSFSASFPRFPRNTEQMRATRLYTEPVYPVTVDGELPVMHAWDGCPEAGLVDYYGSAEEWESGSFETCPACKFTASALGSVASASTSIDNGFEYHYDAVAQAAADYQKARADAEPLSRAAKGKAEGLLDEVLAALGDAGAFRIKADPPGAAGCIAFVVSTGTLAPTAFESAFAPSGALGTRAAVSAATLIRDESEEASVVGDLLDDLAGSGSVVSGVGGLVLDGWAGVLEAYGSGVEGLQQGVEALLSGVPLVGSTGLGKWAADGLREGLQAVGLEPADTAPLKPVLAGTEAVARAGGGDWSARYLSLREQALSRPEASDDALGLLAGRVSDEAYQRLASLEITLAVVEVPLTGVAVPLTVTLPATLAEGAAGLVDGAFAALRNVVGVPVYLERGE